MLNQGLKPNRWRDSKFLPHLLDTRAIIPISLAVLLLLWWQAGTWYRKQLLVNERLQVAEQLSTYGNALTIAVHRNFARLEGLKAFVEANPSSANLDDHFELFAAGLYISEGEIRNLIIAPGGVNQYVYPLQGNEAAVGHDLLNDPRPEVGGAARRAIEHHRMVVTGPYELLQGGRGLVARQPIFHDNKFWGLISLTIDVPRLIEDAGLNARPNSLEVALRNQSEGVFYGPDAVFDYDPVIYIVPLPDGDWKLAGYPSNGWEAMIQQPLLIFRTGGLLIVTMLFVMIYVEMSRRAALELAVKERTAELEHEAWEHKEAATALRESEDRYRRLSDATEEAIAIHEKGIILDANQALAHMFGYEPSEVIGMNVLEFAAPEWRNFLLQKIQEEDEKPYEGMAMKKDGTSFPAEVYGRASRYQGRTVRIAAIRDLTELKRRDSALRDSERRYRLLFDSNPLPMWVYDLETLAFLAVNDAAMHHYGYSRKEFLAMTIKDIRPPEDVPSLLENLSRVTGGLDEAGIWRHRKKDGALIGVEITSYVLTFAGRRAKLVLANDITERKRAEDSLRKSESRYRTLFEFAPDGILIADAQSYYLDANASMCRMLGYSRDELIGLHASDIVAPTEIQYIEPALSAIKDHSDYHREWQFRRKNGSIFAGEASVIVMPDGNLLAVIRDITERKRAQAALLESEARFRSFMNNNATIAWMKDEYGRHVYISDPLEERYGVRIEEWQGKTDFEIWPREIAETLWKNDQEVLRSNKPMEIIEEIKDQKGNLVYWLNFKFPFQDADGKKYVGGIGVDITERKEYERKLEALAAVSAASRSVQTRGEMLAVIMEQTMSLMSATGASIVLSDPARGDTVVEARQGEFSTPAGFRIPHGQGIAGRVIATGQPYITNDLPNDPLMKFQQPPNLKGLVSVPLVTSNGIIGVLQIAGRNQFAESLIPVLVSVADMAASAIQRVTLYEKNLAHTRELSQAYEETLTGWARALELRDEPTEGHTRRVTDLTLKLARKMNVSEDELQHIRRGCILHDIGKMGIPDSILRKPGRLTARETMIMRRHPQYALEMLISIPFLRPALDIPYCHHEKWDGTGYPRGLKGKRIPLAARIFAVVDVWDALTSDRPYRGPWSARRASGYIRKQAGKHFDPRVVNVFLSMLAD